MHATEVSNSPRPNSEQQAAKTATKAASLSLCILPCKKGLSAESWVLWVQSAPQAPNPAYSYAYVFSSGRRVIPRNFTISVNTGLQKILTQNKNSLKLELRRMDHKTHLRMDCITLWEGAIGYNTGECAICLYSIKRLWLEINYG